MEIKEYREYYVDLMSGILGGNRVHFNITRSEDDPKIAVYNNYRKGLLVLSLVSLIEANFVTKKQFKQLRNFIHVPELNSSINQCHLSCFIYVRDCFGHNPSAKLLGEGDNTTEFKRALDKGNFEFVDLKEDGLQINNTHELHLLILRFYGQLV